MGRTISVQRPVGDDARPAEKVAGILPILRDNAQRADRDSRLPAESITALRAAGVFRLGVPRECGGYEVGPTGLLEVVAEVATACPSSAWIVMTAYGAGHLAANLHPRAREEIWPASLDQPLCGSFTGVGVTVRTVEEGFVVSGRWPSASGCYHARHAVLGIPLPGPDHLPPARGLALVPVAAMSIDDTWDMAGMRGTGSATLVADNVFVPDHGVRPFADFLDRTGPPRRTIYDIPVGALSVTTMGPALGAARTLFQSTLSAVGKPMASTFYTRRADSPSVQASIADAAVLLDCAQLLVERATAKVEAAALDGLVASLVERTRVRMDLGHASGCLRRAVSMMLAVNGAGGLSNAHPMQRFWRDVNTALAHPTLNEGMSREMYGRALVGVEEPISPVI